MSMITVLVLAAMLLAVIALFNGIVSMAHGGQEDLRESHRLMFKRVAGQGVQTRRGVTDRGARGIARARD